MRYPIEWKPSALREFKKLPESIRNAVEREVEQLGDEPRPSGCRKLAGFESAYRVRIADYRLVYEVHDKSVLVYILRIRLRGQA